MKTQVNIETRIFSIIIAILTPLVVILTAVRLMMTPLFLQVEYRIPGFPEDPYGFSQAERLKWSQVSMDYLLSNDEITVFDQYKQADGSPLYTERELVHMDDVKVLVGSGRNVWLAILVVFTGLSIYLYARKKMHPWYKGLIAGGYATLTLIGMMLLSTFTNFDWLFTEFHHLFFTGDSWLFLYSDTFIRLFPIRFWSDAFIFTGVLSVIAALTLIFTSNRKLLQ
jgi:integral membrane protein (TIGR01906 family)